MSSDEQGPPSSTHHTSLITVQKRLVDALADFGRQRALVTRVIEGGNGEIIRLAYWEASDRIAVGAAYDDRRAGIGIEAGRCPHVDFVSCQIGLAVQRPAEGCASSAG